jgi:hypothetical protein
MAINSQHCPLAEEFMFNLVPNAVRLLPIFLLRHTDKLVIKTNSSPE